MSRRDTGVPKGLREFGLALVRDDRIVVDHRSAQELTDRLARQSVMAAVDGQWRHESSDVAQTRRRLFGQFVRLYRRHIRRLAAADAELVWEGDAACRPPLRMAEAVRVLPPELREALLIVVVGRFSHQDAAVALDLPLATLVERLARARERVAQLSLMGAEVAVPEPDGRAAHLRVVK